MDFKVNNKEELECFVAENWNTINSYIDSESIDIPMPIYNSVDIRESSKKMAPVDNNIYPAGFNNVCMLDLESTSLNLEKYINLEKKNINRIAIISESHTKNTFYLDHLAFLKKAINDAGFDDVSIISFDNNLFPNQEELNLISASNFDIKIEKASINEGEIMTSNGKIDYAILNNDQSDPILVEWDSVKTPVNPTPKIGWNNRSKSGHFLEYHHVLVKFCRKFSINPSLLEANFQFVEDVDFSGSTGFDKIAEAVDAVKSSPDTKVFIKGDKGTYGMGISVVGSGEEVLSLNRKSRKKMNAGKNNLKFTSVIVQEGIETVIKYDDMPAEVTIYLIGGKSVGGFMRANSEKGNQENLNSRGMVFKKFCISEIRENQDHKSKEAVYSIIARLSSLASGHEILKKTLK